MKKVIVLILFMALSFIGCSDTFVLAKPTIDVKILIDSETIIRITDIQINKENPKEVIATIKGYKIN